MRRTMICIGSLVALLLLVAVASYAELVAHWPMDEGSGDTIQDIVGKGGVGTFAGKPRWVDGKMGGALEFDGSSSVSIASTPDLEPASVTGTMWIYFNDVAPPRQDFFSKNDDYALSLHEWADDGTIYPIIRSPANVWTVQKGTLQIEAGRWYHVALVYDAGSEDLVSYIDGEEDARTISPGGIGKSGGPLTLGDYGGRPLKGLLDEVKIWNEALSQADIRADMESGLTTVDSHGKLANLWGQIKSPEQR